MRFVEHRGFLFFASTLKITEQGMMVHKGNSCQIMAEDHCDSQVLISMIGMFFTTKPGEDLNTF